jgi:uncharacterized protein
MGVDETTLVVLGVVFLATTIRTALGFGEALVAVPLLALRIPIDVAVPLATLVSITVAAAVLVQDWHRVHLGSAWRLVVATFCGIPLGVWVLTGVPEPIVKVILGIVIIAFSGWCLSARRPPELKGDRTAWAFGFAAGVLGGAYGMNGPPLAVYGTLRRWTAERFRATLQGYFLPASIAGMIGYTLKGLWVPAVTSYYLFSLPLVVAAVLVGRRATRRLDARSFIRFVHVGLVLVGAILLAQAMR